MSYKIYQTVPFSKTLNDPYPRFQGHTILLPNTSEMAKDMAIVAASAMNNVSHFTVM